MAIEGSVTKSEVNQTGLETMGVPKAISLSGKNISNHMGKIEAETA